jgi:hypothetical protein
MPRFRHRSGGKFLRIAAPRGHFMQLAVGNLWNKLLTIAKLAHFVATIPLLLGKVYQT